MGNPTEQRQHLEKRRLEAAALFEVGVRKSDIAEMLNVSRTAVWRWWKAWEAGSDLKAKRTPGRPLRLGDESTAKLMRLIEDHPDMKSSELRAWIYQEFGVKYHEDHIHRLRKSLMQRSQQP